MPIEVLRAEEANGNLRSRICRWPDGRRVQDRLGEFTTVMPSPSFKISRDDLIFTSGSCFARNIEAKLASLGFTLPMLAISTPEAERVSSTENEILNKYTTASVINEMEWALGIERFPDHGFLHVADGLVHDPYLHPGTPAVTLDRARERREEIHRLVRILPQCRLFILTLGLVEAWFDRTTTRYLNGAPPPAAIAREPDRFELHRQSHADIMRDLNKLHGLIAEHGHPDFRMLVSVSPVPFKATFSGRDAISANSYSKAVLRAAAEEFVTAHGNVDYFPSFEMVTHSNREFAYEVDNIHVRAPVVGKIMDIAANAYVDGVVSQTSKQGFEGKPADELMVLARQFHLEKRYDLSVRLLEYIERNQKVGESGESEFEFYLYYGVMLARAGLNREAEPHLYRAVALKPNNARAVYKLGLITGRLRRPASLAYLKRAAKLNPNDPDYHWRIGEAYRKSEERSKAMACFRRALAVNPNHSASLLAMQAIKAGAA